MTVENSSQSGTLRNTAIAVHALNVASVMFGVTALIAVVIAFLKRQDARGTFWEGHFSYAIRTFFIALLASLVFGVLTIIGIGFLGMMALLVWWVIRTVSALLKALDDKPISNPKTWLI